EQVPGHLGAPEDERVVVEARVVRDPLRREAVHAGLRLQRYGEEPQHGQDEGDGHRGQSDGVRPAAAARAHAALPPRWMSRAATKARPRFRTSRITATAAARPASMLAKAARYMKSETTSVRRAGPPPVRGRMRSKVLRVWMVTRARFRASTGLKGGSSTTRKRSQAPSPSRSAASCSSRGIRCRPAKSRIMLKAQPRHPLAAMSEARARGPEETSGSGPWPRRESQ